MSGVAASLPKQQLLQDEGNNNYVVLYFAIYFSVKISPRFDFWWGAQKEIIL